jgi:hypothetical protein
MITIRTINDDRRALPCDARTVYLNNADQATGAGPLSCAAVGERVAVEVCGRRVVGNVIRREVDVTEAKGAA